MVRMPATMKEAFITGCRGVQTYAAAAWGTANMAQAVLPRSLR
jgi:hypothetical protein